MTRAHNTNDLTGRIFGLITVTAYHSTVDGRAFWTCSCMCGEITVKKAKYLLNGDTHSCGCAQTARRARGNPKAGHGGATGGKIAPEYQKWRDAKERCYNPKNSKYKFYGAIGVAMAEEWRHDYPAFLAHMGPCPLGLTLDRIDPHGNYEPGNCRWAPWSVQFLNKRRHHPRPLSESPVERA